MRVRGRVCRNALECLRLGAAPVEIQLCFIGGSHFQQPQNKRKKLIAALPCNYILIYRPNSHNPQQFHLVLENPIQHKLNHCSQGNNTQIHISYRSPSETLDTTHAGRFYFILQVRKYVSEVLRDFPEAPLSPPPDQVFKPCQAGPRAEPSTYSDPSFQS